VNFKPSTSMVVGPAAVGVNITVYLVPDPERAPIEPFVTLISVAIKSAVALLEVKINSRLASFVVDSFATGWSLEFSALIVMVGATLSYVQVNWGAAELLLPVKSVNFELATSMVVSPAALGVNVAV